MRKIFTLILIGLLLSACRLGPDYKTPPIIVPANFKEGGKIADIDAIKPGSEKETSITLPEPAHQFTLPPPRATGLVPKGWKRAEPQDDLDRGNWWCIFHDPDLDALELQLNVSNQNIVGALAQYQQSLALVGEAKAAAYPVVTATLSANRQKPSSSTFNNTSGTGTGGITANGNKSLPPFSTYILSFNASWTPDLWGSVRRAIEANADTAEATAAFVASARLSAQSTLAQDYFWLRTYDALQQLWEETVQRYQRLLDLTYARYHAGTASMADIAQANSQLQGAIVASIDNGLTRAQYEHAIAVLLGQPPSIFYIPPKVLTLKPPVIPAVIPSELLERRPDVAQAERQVAAANAEIGVAEAAFYPTLPLTASTGYQTNKVAQWFSSPAFFWILGAQLIGSILDGGLHSAALAAAISTHQQTIATYRQTVLTAFQNVEDGLAAQRILSKEAVAQARAVGASQTSLGLTAHDYRRGTNDITTVLSSQVTLYTSQINQIVLTGRQMVAAAELIAAIGGGWDSRPSIQKASVPTPVPSGVEFR